MFQSNMCAIRQVAAHFYNFSHRSFNKALQRTLKCTTTYNIAALKCMADIKLESRNMSGRRFSTDSKMNPAKHIVWVDLEMTGLDVDKDHILEIACLITDSELNVVATGPDIIIHQCDEILKNMNEWCISQHGQSGLTENSRSSNISLKDAESTVLKFIENHVPKGRCPLGGNSIYMDRLFIRKYMPRIDAYLHYRVIDVSSIKELARRWYPKQFSNMPTKTFQHRSLSDISETINELQYYKNSIFK